MPVVDAPAPRRRSRTLAATFAAGAVVVLALAPAVLAAGNATIVFASDTTWQVSDGDAAIGPTLSLPAAAQHVCLNDTSPSPCPAGATIYGWPGVGWGADLSAIPGAAWIWAPGIDGATEPADEDVYRFTRTIAVAGTPVSGTISVAADDGAEVIVNGTSVGSTSSSGVMATFDITAYLVRGNNQVVVEATNGLICDETCTYADNPGGTVFGGAITYTPDPVVVPTTPPTSTVVAADGGSPSVGVAVAVAAIGAIAAVIAILDRRARVRR